MTKTTTKNILNVIVYYNNDAEIRQYIDDVLQIGQGITDLLIVVNSDRDGKVPALREDLARRGAENVRIIDYHENLGYLNALLKPISDEQFGGYQYYILSNTDIHYPDPAFFRTLMNHQYDPKIGCIAPSVYNPGTQSYSNPHYRTRIPKEHLQRVSRIFAHPAFARLYLELAAVKARFRKQAKQASCAVYSPHGCYMIFTGRFIGSIKGYEYGVKMYSEESCVGELLRQKGYQCYYDASMEVIHDASSVTGKVDYRKRFTLWKESVDYILEAFYE